jgi:hypothetical protein
VNEHIAEFEELLEQLLERSESDCGLDAAELGIVVRRFREMFDLLVRLGVAATRVPDTRGHVLRLLRTVRSLRHRCGLALMFIERGATEEAVRVLRLGVGDRGTIPSGSAVPDDLG